MSEEKADSQLSEISGKLDTLIRISALNLIKDVSVQGERIAMLSFAGFAQGQIAAILDTTSHTVRQRLYEKRKGIRRKKK